MAPPPAEAISYLGAFGAGILSFLSPCVLPLVPGYLSYVSGIGVEDMQQNEGDRRQIILSLLWSSSWFILGFTIVFVTLGATATLFGQTLLQNSIWLARIAGVMVFLFGLHMTHLLPIPFLNRMKQFDLRGETTGPVAALLLGASFSIGWTPCIGPILTGILAVASQQQTLGEGMGLLAIYSAGLGIPFLLASLLIGSFFGWYRKFSRHLRKIEIVSGIMLMLVGVLLMANRFNWLAQRLQILLT